MPRAILLIAASAAIAIPLVVACGSNDRNGPGTARLPQGTVTVTLATSTGALVEDGWVDITLYDAHTFLDLKSGYTDAAGRFAATFVRDSQPKSAVVSLRARTPYGSGYDWALASDSLTLDSVGVTDTLHVALVVPRSTDPVSPGPPVLLEPGKLVGRWAGATVPPGRQGTTTYLWITIDSVADSVRGHYEMEFSATTTCGTGFGTFTGSVRSDTLALQLTTDSVDYFPYHLVAARYLGWTPASGIDTLIMENPSGVGCDSDSPAPLQLLRQ